MDEIKKTAYVLITSARNEEAYIEKTIRSVIAQTVLPKRWVIVSDGSADRTDEIVKQYEANYDFINFVRKESDNSWNYASKVYAIRAGLELLNNVKYDFIGNLDADISFEPSYYEHILAKFRGFPHLGIAGGTIFELKDGVYQTRFGNTIRSVPGALQLFRRQCFEEIGGYIPLKTGGVDVLAQAMARMHGWEVRSFLEFPALHHRRTGWSKESIYKASLKLGVMDYHLGMHPLYSLFKSLRRLLIRPYVLGAVLRMVGFTLEYIKGQKRQIPIDVVNFVRREQLERIWYLFLRNKENY
jgi:biofilm PGA synthesis N-glycosyltransferase PgaC